MKITRLITCLIPLLIFSIHISYGQENEFIAPDFEVGSKKFGLPEAEVLETDYEGPAVVGENLTLLPDIAPLKPGNRVHEIRMDALVSIVEVAPGVKFKAWTFGGTVPGPVLHVREGDLVHFTMKNRTDSPVKITEPGKGHSPFLDMLVDDQSIQKPEAADFPMPHSMDFHAGTVAKDDKWRTIKPGMTIKYYWYANYPGVYIYHCGTEPVFQHLSMGQYGLVIVSPKEGYPTDDQVDKSFAIVQSEFYLTEGIDGLYKLDYDAALNKQPKIVAFNGHSRAMITNPLRVEKGDRVRFYLLNVGPTDVSSNHVIGGIFDRVYYEGNPANEFRGMQTVLLGASNGAVLEWIVPEEGLYVLVDHEFADAAKGATAKIIAGKTSEK